MVQQQEKQNWWTSFIPKRPITLACPDCYYSIVRDAEDELFQMATAFKCPRCTQTHAKSQWVIVGIELGGEFL